MPGHTTNALPAGTGVLLHKGAKVVMQVHYNLIEASGPDRSRAQLRLRPATTHLTPLETHLIAAPVELPCPERRPAARSARAQQALQDEIAKYGAEAAFIPYCAAAGSAARRSPTTRRTSAPARSIATSCDRPFTLAADDLRRRRATCTCAGSDI